MQKFLSSHDLPYLRKLSSILKKQLFFVDLETTGLVHEHNFSIIEIGVVVVTPDLVMEKSGLLDPGMSIPHHITEITGITNQMVRGKKKFTEFAHFFQNLSDKHILVGYNSKSFDSRGLIKMGQKHGKNYVFANHIDVRHLFLRERNKALNIKSQKGNLTQASEFYQAKLSGDAHRAAYDIALTALLMENILAKHGLSSVEPDINKFTCIQTKKLFSESILKL